VTTTQSDVGVAVARLVRWLESGEAPVGLVTDDVFADLTFPRWRVQTEGGDSLIRARQRLHPRLGKVVVERVDRTERGFTIEFEERWLDAGQNWYCREQMRCDLRRDSIAELSLYCTGDWDEARVAEHAAAVSLIRRRVVPLSQ
jgi:hypothetical protein